MSEKGSSSPNSSGNGESQCGRRNEQSVTSQTEHQNEVNSKRTVHSQRYDAYRLAIYGDAAQKEAHRQQIRAKLKEQVQEKDELHQKQLVDRVAESDRAVALDQQSKQEDNANRQKKATYLKQFSNENKRIMEEKEKNTRRAREAETELERKLLEINPINWNMTLH